MSDRREPHPGRRPGQSREEAEAAAERRIWLRNASRREARGLEELEHGNYELASKLLLDAVRIYEEYQQDDGILSAAQYLGVALYEQGKTDRAVAIWEEMLSRGWLGPTIYGLLVRHYTERGDTEEIERLTHELRATWENGGRSPRPQEEAPVEARPGKRPPQTGTRILVADNDDETRDVLARLLRMEGYGIIEAADGEKALNAALSDSPDLIVMDVYMPKLSGVDVLYQIRAAGMRTPTIIISGMADASMVRDAVVLGADFMQKPVFIDDLRACIEKQLARPGESSSQLP